ncbi:MAG: EthD domain-containing protein, partial [Parvibaculales bacterium]
MYKVLMPLKRKADMSVDDFRHYYENYHRLIGEKYLQGYATKYIRRYINPLPDAEGRIAEPDFDVLLEIWFP